MYVCITLNSKMIEKNQFVQYNVRFDMYFCNFCNEQFTVHSTQCIVCMNTEQQFWLHMSYDNGKAQIFFSFFQHYAVKCIIVQCPHTAYVL